MDPACRDALLLVTTRVLELGQRVTAGDLAAHAEIEALAALLEQSSLQRDRK